MWIEAKNNMSFSNISSKNSIQENIFSVFQNNNFQQKREELQFKVDEFIKAEKTAQKSQEDLYQNYKDKKITAEDYTQKVKNLLPWDVFKNPRYPLEKKIRELKVQEDIAHIMQTNIFYSTSQLWENISDGGSNNLWVFVLDKNMVARCSKYGYDDGCRLILYKDKITSSVIKKTLQITEIDNKVYQVQQRAYWSPILNLTNEELATIPVEHYRAFWKAIQEMRMLWLSLDISGWKSNVLYDLITGFSIIDLGIGEMPTDSLIEEIIFKKQS